MKVNKKFLEKKFKGRRASCGNISRISDLVFNFTEYNFLPGEDGVMDGHYDFFVNVETFEYLVYQSSYYGSFTYTTASRNTEWLDTSKLNKRELETVESLIAHKLLGMYFYDYTATNSKGANYFSDKKKESAGKNFYGEPITRWLDGAKISLITDYRGYIWVDLKPNERDPKSIEAIRRLEPSYNLRKVKSFKLGKITDRKLFSENYGKFSKNAVTYTLPIDVTLKDNTRDTLYLLRYLSGLNSRTFIFLDKDKKPLGEYPTTYSGKPSNIIKMIPKYIESL